MLAQAPLRNNTRLLMLLDSGSINLPQWGWECIYLFIYLGKMKSFIYHEKEYSWINTIKGSRTFIHFYKWLCALQSMPNTAHYISVSPHLDQSLHITITHLSSNWIIWAIDCYGFCYFLMCLKGRRIVFGFPPCIKETMLVWPTYKLLCVFFAFLMPFFLLCKRA